MPAAYEDEDIGGVVLDLFALAADAPPDTIDRAGEATNIVERW